MEIHLNMYQTLAVAVLVLLFGNFLRHRIGFLEKFCIPAPVIGKYAWYFSLPRSVFRPT